MNVAPAVSEDSEPALASAILVVEDEVLVRVVVTGFLRDCGFDVFEAANAVEAIRILQAGVRIDVVFSDVNMPGDMDGFGLSQWIGRECPDAKVILTSGIHRTASDARELRAHGPVMAKPYSHAELEQRIREMLAP
jgi:CheY-like chemotaxis protein